MNAAGKAAKAQWAKLSKEERSAEMSRRIRLGRQNRKLKERQANSKIRHAGSGSSLKNLLEATSASIKAQDQEQYSQHVSYLFGKVETIIEYYANSNSIPVSALTEGVASLLQHKKGG